MTAVAWRHKARGSVFIIVACVLWAVTFAWRETLLETYSAYWNTLAMALCALPMLALTLPPNWALLLTCLRRHAGLFLAYGACGLAIGSQLFFLALQQLPFGLTSLLVQLEPLFVTLLAVTFLGERLYRRQILFVVLAFVAATLLVAGQWQGGGNVSLFGLGVAAAAAFAWSVAETLGKHALNQGITVRELVFARFLFGSFALLPFAPLFWAEGQADWARLTLADFAQHLFITFLGAVPAFWLYLRGLQETPASLATYLALSMPITSLILAVLWKGESFTDTQLFLLPVFFMAIVGLSLPHKRHASRQSGEPLAPGTG